MSHEGRMSRGKENYEKNILLDNEDTKYYLANVDKKEEVKEEKPKKKKR
jgi:hypothetical protein